MKLSERLQNLQKTMATEKKTQYERLEAKIQGMKTRMLDAQEISQRKYKVIKEQMIRVAAQIESQRKQREEVIQAKKKEMLAMQTRI